MTARSPDLILHNANAITMDPRQPRADTVVVKDSRIAFVGRSDDLGAVSTSGTLKIDCQGKTVLPGFNDAHCHILAYASALLSLDCSPASVSSIADIQDRIREQAERTPPATWIKAVGYNEFYLIERRHPTRRDLDQAASNHPVKLTHRSQHACVLNSLALSLAGITAETPDPPGGLIDREPESGEPSGLLFGMNSYVNKVTPLLTERELAQGMKLANQNLLSLGITSVQDATITNGWQQWQMFKGLKNSGRLLPRLCMMFGLHALGDFDKLGPGHGDSNLRLGMIKLAVDETSGQVNPPQPELNKEVLLAHQAGFPVAIHAIEEGTVEAAATALEYCRRYHPKSDIRHRIEHCSVCPPPLLKRLKAVNAVVVIQPPFIYYSGERYSQTVTEQQLPWLYRIRSFLENELRPAAGSDCPVVPPDPLIGLYAAASRSAENGQTLSPEEAISPAQALQMYTLAAAYASGEEREKGTIEVGKLADLVILSDDPTTAPLEEIKDIRVEKTIINGKVVWER